MDCVKVKVIVLSKEEEWLTVLSVIFLTGEPVKLLTEMAGVVDVVELLKVTVVSGSVVFYE